MSYEVNQKYKGCLVHFPSWPLTVTDVLVYSHANTDSFLWKATEMQKELFEFSASVHNPEKVKE